MKMRFCASATDTTVLEALYILVCPSVSERVSQQKHC